MTAGHHLRNLSEEYAEALDAHLSRPDESELARAYELGRTALAEGHGVLEVAAWHSRALERILTRPMTAAELTRTMAALDQFQNEALSPFEMARRAFGDANVALRRLNDVLEGRIRRIASALHDEAAQLLVSVHLSLASLAGRQPTVASDVQSIRRLLDEIELRLRGLSHELRPPILEDLGLPAALEYLAESVSRRWNLTVSVGEMSDDRLPTTVETTLYRIVQEALTNVGRHAKATSAEIDLIRSPHKVACSVRDDGIGFDATRVAARPGPRGLGLVEIQERVVALGGSVRMDTDVHRGTALTVEIPLEM